MRNTVFGRILFYIALWAFLFLLLCVISIVKNADILKQSLDNTITSIIGSLSIIGLIIYGIYSALRSALR